MKTTRISCHTRFQIAPVDPRVFGGFLEHMGRAVYEGVYDPSSRHADAEGCRSDVLEALRQLDMTVMRYPGGNFVSGYHWTDGVGKREDRPTVRELAWKSIESNHFGTDEYIHLCRKMGWTPMLAVNLGTGTPEEACQWVEYCNAPAGTRYADMRVAHGNTQPHGVKLWCLGNEMDGPWQLGHVPANVYAIRAQQAAKMMKEVDASIELVACGSCAIDMDTYMEWDRQVLEHLGDWADYISLHRYVGNKQNDTPAYLSVTSSLDRQIEEMDAVCRFVQAKRRSRKRAYLCFDEWNVWYKDRGQDGGWKVAPPLLEETYNLEDALVVAGFLHSFVRHADVVKVANLAQIVNVIAPIITRGDELLLQSIFYPFAMFSQRRNGMALRVEVDGPMMGIAEKSDDVHVVDASVIMGKGVLHVFLTNRDMHKQANVEVDLVDATVVGCESADVVTAANADPKAANTFEQPDQVTSRPLDTVAIRDGKASCTLPALSFAALTLTLG